MRVRSLIPFLAVPLIAAAVPLVWLPAAEKAVVGPDGVRPGLFDGALLELVALGALILLLVALLGMAFHKTRRAAVITVLACVSYYAGFSVGRGLRDNIRRDAFHQLATRSRPLIVAIRAFEQRQGHPPASLHALAPEFIPSVPVTGMGAYPEYQYRLGSTNDFGNPWVLTVPTPPGGMNFDQFLYFPLTNYPNHAFGGWLEPIEDWAYVHE